MTVHPVEHFVRSGSDGGREGLARSLCVFDISKVFDGLEVRVLCEPVKFFHIKLIQPCLYGPGFVHWGTGMLE